jgi:hypothetical protein
MWDNNLAAPAITTDLWEGIRDRLRVPRIEKILGLTDAQIAASKSRVYVEGGQPDGAEGTESEAWARLVVVPGDPVGEQLFQPGIPQTVAFIIRGELNSRARPGNTGYRHSRHLQGLLREAYRVLEEWSGPISSNEVMIAGEARADAGWRPQMLDDRQRTGTFVLSQRYSVDVAEAPNAA